MVVVVCDCINIGNEWVKRAGLDELGDDNIFEFLGSYYVFAHHIHAHGLPVNFQAFSPGSGEGLLSLFSPLAYSMINCFIRLVSLPSAEL